MFTCEYCKIFKNIIFYRTTLMVAFDNSSCGNMIYRKSRRLNTTSSILAKLYLFKVNNKDIRMTSFNLLEEISHIAVVFPLLTLNKKMQAMTLFAFERVALKTLSSICLVNECFYWQKHYLITHISHKSLLGAWLYILQIFLLPNWVFCDKHWRFTGQQRKEEAISLTLLYHSHPLHRHLDIR